MEARYDMVKPWLEKHKIIETSDPYSYFWKYESQREPTFSSAFSSLEKMHDDIVANKNGKTEVSFERQYPVAT